MADFHKSDCKPGGAKAAQMFFRVNERDGDISQLPERRNCWYDMQRC
jgi:hypothetical protein